MIGLEGKVDLNVEGTKIVITPSQKEIRVGWEEMIIKEITTHGHPERLIPDYFDDENQEDWTW